MSWEKIKIGEFLFERENRYKPNDEKIQELQRVEKIDFSGNLLISNKPSKTNMILIKQGDLVISGINVSKGAMGIYHGKKDITATIHYSSYSFDEKKINIEYFEKFLQSRVFIKLLKEQVKGGIKTEIKAKHLLPLEISLPPLQEQKKIAKKLKLFHLKQKTLFQKIQSQKIYLKKLREQILQNGIEGKLTKQWREKNTNLEPASELLEKIKEEKEKLVLEKKIKKQKGFLPIEKNEIPFELPKSWVWCRLGEVSNFIYGSSLTRSRTIPNGKYPVYGSNGIVGYYNQFLTNKKSIIIGRKGSAGLLNVSNLPSWTTDVAYYLEETKSIDFNFLFYLLKSLKLESLRKRIKPGLNRNEVYLLKIPLPPLQEQKVIAEKLQSLMKKYDDAEEILNQSLKDCQLLKDSILAEMLN